MKRLWSLLLALLLIPCLAVAVSAAESGKCGDNLTWKFEDATDTLTISGTGKMWSYYSIDEDDWEHVYTPWERDEVKKVIVEEGVTSIGSGALYKAYELEEVYLPASVAEIEYVAFGDCSISKIRLPANNSLQMDQNAFSGTTISAIEIPDQMETFSGFYFDRQDFSEYIVSEDHPTYSVSDGILFSKDKTELIACPKNHRFADNHYSVPDSVTRIRGDAFYDCAGLKSVTIPTSVTSIGADAFNLCEYIKKVYVSDLEQWMAIGFENASANPMHYGADLYVNGTAVTELVIPDGTVKIKKHVFSGMRCPVSLTIPDSVTEIEEDAFAFSEAPDIINIMDLIAWSEIRFDSAEANPLASGGILYVKGEPVTELVFPDGTTTVGNYTFTNCDTLASVRFPDSVTSIGNSAFSYCDKLTDVTIPDSVTHIGNYAFADCSSLRSIGIGKSVVSIGNFAFRNAKKVTTVSVPDTVTAIGDGVFAGCSELTEIQLPKGLTELSRKLFQSCIKLDTVMIPDTVTVIGESTFEKCYALTDVQLPEGLTEIGNCAFRFCEKLTSVSIPDTVATIGDYAFKWCVNLEEVRLPRALTSINDWLFEDCTKLTTVVIQENVTDIRVGAFNGCTVLTAVNIPESVTTIGTSAFSRCRGLTSVTVPDSVTAIGAHAFAGCSGITELNLGAGLQKVEKYAFSGCKRIKELNIPGSVGEVPFGLAEKCISLQRVTMGEGITYIARDAFSGCTKLKAITLPSTLREIYTDAFDGCTGLRDFHIPNIRTWVDLQFVYENFAEEGEGLSDYYSFDYFTDSNAELKNLYVNGEKLTNVVIPEGTEYLDDYIFHSTSIESVTLPNSISSVSENAFSQCKNLISVGIPAETDYVGKNAFAGCENLKKVYYGGSKTKRGKIDIEGGNTRLKNASWEYNCNLGLDAPVAKITGNTTTGKSKLTWSAVEGAERYRVYRATSKSGSYSYLGYTSTLSYTDKTAKAGTNYYYKVTAYDTGTKSESLYSNIVNRVCDLKKPVVTLKADTASGKPKVTWEKISGAAKYYIARATSENGTYSKLATVTGTSYVDKTAKAGKTYYYKVKALHAKDAADSVYSETVSRVCDLKKPVVSIKLYKNDPRLTWEKISGTEKYQVYRATSKSGEYKLVKTTKSSTSFTDTDVKAGKTYYYKVKAIHENPEANSAYSAVKYIKAK